MPYVARYRGRAMAALVALLVAAVATLVVPLAVRRMIDFGFSAERIGLIDSYFAVMIARRGACSRSRARRATISSPPSASASSPICAQRVFAHLTSLSPAFFDTAKTGELISRLTADTTQIKSRGRLLGVGRVAQPRAVRRRAR